MDSLDLESLDIHIDNLESSLRPFIKNTLAASTSKLPLLDRAKIYVLIVYAVEATLFCISCLKLQMNDTDIHSICAASWRRGQGASGLS
jgi:exosome complex protein LRP1